MKSRTFNKRQGSATQNFVPTIRKPSIEALELLTHEADLRVHTKPRLNHAPQTFSKTYLKNYIEQRDEELKKYKSIHIMEHTPTDYEADATLFTS